MGLNFKEADSEQPQWILAPQDLQVWALYIVVKGVLHSLHKCLLDFSINLLLSLISCGTYRSIWELLLYFDTKTFDFAISKFGVWVEFLFDIFKLFFLFLLFQE